MRFLILLIPVLCACNGDDTLAPDGICTRPVCASASSLCTTAACASGPCTPGCRFHNARGNACPPDLPRSVDARDVISCAHLCGFVVPSYEPSGYTTTAAGSCFHYDANAPGCAGVPACEGYNDACWVSTVGFGEDEAGICAAVDTCADGAYPQEDAAQPNTCVDLARID
jgi:hypothetical protein